MPSMIFAAFQLGFVYSLLPGPILIASSQCVVTGGWRRGCWFILGVTLADAIYIAIIHWGLSSSLMNNQLISLALWILGGAWLIKIGFDALRVLFSDQSPDEVHFQLSDFRRTLTLGFCINLFNPLTIVGWVALGANFVMLSTPSLTIWEGGSLLLLLTILLGMLTWQLLVVGFISVIRQQMHQRLLKLLSLVGGSSLIVYGLGAWVSAINLIS